MKEFICDRCGERMPANNRAEVTIKVISQSRSSSASKRDLCLACADRADEAMKAMDYAATAEQHDKQKYLPF